MELKTYIAILWRRKWVVLAVTATALFLAILIALRITPMYSASATVRVWKNSAGYEDVTYTERLMSTYARVITSGSVMNQLEHELDLGTLPSVEVEFPPNTELMQIIVEHPNPETAANSANTLAEILISQSQGTRGERDYTVSLIGPASEPGNSSSLAQEMTIVLGIIVGLGGGFGLAFLLENLDTSLYTVTRIEEVTGLSTVGKIPHLRQQKKSTFMNKNTPEGEAFRHLRTMLFAIGRDTPLRSILVTSAAPGEGKTTIIANLALALAQSGQKVVVVDGDLRRPAIHTIFDLPNETGLSSVLQQATTTEEALQSSVIPGIYVLTSGPTPSNPAELLTSPHMDCVLKELSGKFDITLVDTPGALAVTDASVLALITDGVLLVVRRADSHQEAVQETCLQLMNIKARLIGVVVNGVDRSSIAQEYYQTMHA